MVSKGELPHLANPPVDSVVSVKIIKGLLIFYRQKEPMRDGTTIPQTQIFSDNERIWLEAVFQLEVALAEYVSRYGLTEKARVALRHSEELTVMQKRKARLAATRVATAAS